MLTNYRVRLAHEGQLLLMNREYMTWLYPPSSESETSSEEEDYNDDELDDGHDARYFMFIYSFKISSISTPT